MKNKFKMLVITCGMLFAFTPIAQALWVVSYCASDPIGTYDAVHHGDGGGVLILEYDC